MRSLLTLRAFIPCIPHARRRQGLSTVAVIDILHARLCNALRAPTRMVQIAAKQQAHVDGGGIKGRSWLWCPFGQDFACVDSLLIASISGGVVLECDALLTGSCWRAGSSNTTIGAWESRTVCIPSPSAGTCFSSFLGSSAFAAAADVSPSARDPSLLFISALPTCPEQWRPFTAGEEAQAR